MWSDEDSGGDDFDWESTEEGSYNADVQIDDAWINALLLDDNSSENDSTTTSSSQQASAPGRTMLGPMMVEPMIIHPQQEQQQKPEEPQKTANTEHKRPRQSYVSKQLPPQPKRKARGPPSVPPFPNHGGKVELPGLTDLISHLGLVHKAPTRPSCVCGDPTGYSRRGLTLYGSLSVTAAAKHKPIASGARGRQSRYCKGPHNWKFYFGTMVSNEVEIEVNCCSSHFGGDARFSLTFRLGFDGQLMGQWEIDDLYVVDRKDPGKVTTKKKEATPLVEKPQAVSAEQRVVTAQRSSILHSDRCCTLWGTAKRAITGVVTAALVWFFDMIIFFLTNPKSRELWNAVLKFALQDVHYENPSCDETHFLVLTERFFSNFLHQISGRPYDLSGKIYCALCGTAERGAHDLMKHNSFYARFPHLTAYVTESPHLRDAVFGIFARFLRHIPSAKREADCLFEGYYHCIFCGRPCGSHDDDRHKVVQGLYKEAMGSFVDEKAFSSGSMRENDVADHMARELYYGKLGSMLAGNGEAVKV